MCREMSWDWRLEQKNLLIINLKNLNGGQESAGNFRGQLQVEV